MYVALAWLANRAQPADVAAQARRRFDVAASTLVPETYTRRDFGGDGWGLTFLHAPEDPSWRWRYVADEHDVTVASLGLPVGLSPAGGPSELGRRLLRGDDIHADVVPPFALIALEGERRLVAQQDWLGMCRVFKGEFDGLTALCSRPSLLAAFLGDVAPDYDGWASYAVSRHFGGNMSPVRGVRLLAPGERFTARRRDEGGWAVTSEIRHSADDVIAAGLAARSRGIGPALDLAARGFTETATSAAGLYDGPITLGLSGGKDSRLIAASFIAESRLPRFVTNDDTAAEGETARALVEILRAKRALDPEHLVARASPPEVVRGLGLAERVRRMQRQHDYQFPSTYTVRSPGSERLPAQSRPLSVTGAAGGLAVGYGYPDKVVSTQSERSTLLTVVMSNVMSAGVPPVPNAVQAAERARVDLVLDRGEQLGLRGLELVDYVHLVEHARRWCTSAYYVGMITPFLHPSCVAAYFAMTPAEKRSRTLHTRLLDRFVPEWADVPFVSVGTGLSTAARVWDGDGLSALHGLLDTTHGDLAHLIRHDVVARTLRDCLNGAGTGRHERTLQQFACLAVASQSLEPAGVRPPSQTYSEFVRAGSSLRNRSLARLRTLARTGPGRRILAAARSGVFQRSG